MARATSDERDRPAARELPRRCDVIAVDGPLVSPRFPADSPRAVERMFSLGAFQKRCRPGASHVPGSARSLREAVVQCLEQLVGHVATSRELLRFPHVVPGVSVIESFPTAFLAGMVDDPTNAAGGGPGAKLAGLLAGALGEGRFAALREHTDWHDAELWGTLATTAEREERAAAIAAATAVCVVRRRYVAVGDLQGGFYFLPPWDLWVPWARAALAENRKRRETAGVEIWINGVPINDQSKLPA